jgi:hypothetical protein
MAQIMILVNPFFLVLIYFAFINFLNEDEDEDVFIIIILEKIITIIIMAIIKNITKAKIN